MKRTHEEMSKKEAEETNSPQLPLSDKGSFNGLSFVSGSIAARDETSMRMAFAGHRGFGVNQVQRQRANDLAFPENSLISLQKVMESGADFIEFDLYLSRDEHLMVIHDDDLSINTRYILQEDDRNKMPDGEGGFFPVGSKVSLNKGSALVSGWDVVELKKRFEIFNGITPPHNVNPNLYNKIPEFHEVLELVSAENARRAGLGLPRVGLNVELKGVGTGKFVQKAIEDFNAKCVNDADEIQQNEIFYISFLDRELATIAGLISGSKGIPVPDSNLILGVPTDVQYSKVGTAYAIEDETLNLVELERCVENLHYALQKLPDRGGKGLSGVDVSMWDVGDDSVKYFCGRLGVPIHIAVVPFGYEDFARDEVSLALMNIEKIAAAQGKYLGSSVTMIIKTDDPALLKTVLEAQSKSKASEISSAEMMKSGRKSSAMGSRSKDGIGLFPKPGTKGAQGKFKQVDNSWWGDQQLIPALQHINIGHVLDPVVNETGLELGLREAMRRTENSFIIPMNVNVVEAAISERDANHWVGLRLVRNADDGRFNVDYVDPMGRAINGRVRDLITETLGANLAAAIAEPLAGRAIQAVQKIEHGVAEERIIQFIGNTNDCGPMLVYAMDRPENRGALLDRALTGGESRILGQNIRNHFAGVISAAAVPEVIIGSELESSVINAAREIGRSITEAIDSDPKNRKLSHSTIKTNHKSKNDSMGR